MSEGEQKVVIEQASLEDVQEELRRTLPFGETNFADLLGIGPIQRVRVPAGLVLPETWAPGHLYAVVLEGEVRADRLEPDGSRTTVSTARTGQGLGEAPILMGKSHSPMIIEAVTDARAVTFSEIDFWKLMAC